MFDLYAEVIQDLCERRVGGIERDRQQLLWLWSEGYLDIWVDQDEVSLNDLQSADIARELYDRVCEAASDEELAVDPDEERDRERYEDDVSPYRPGAETDEDTDTRE
jgi:hypothetical protein